MEMQLKAERNTTGNRDLVSGNSPLGAGGNKKSTPRLVECLQNIITPVSSRWGDTGKLFVFQ